MPTLDDKLYEELSAMHWQFLVEGTVDHPIPLHPGNSTVNEFENYPDAGTSLSLIDTGIDTPAVRRRLLHEHIADARYRKEKNSKQKREKEAAHVSNQTDIMAPFDKFQPTLILPHPMLYSDNTMFPTNCMSVLPPRSYPLPVMQFSMHSSPPQPPWSPLDLTQVPALSNAVSDGRASASINPAYAHIMSEGQRMATDVYSAMPGLFYQPTHPSAQVGSFPLTQPRWDSFRATEAPTLTNGLAHGRTTTYVRESMNEVQTTTVSEAHMPRDGNATYSIPFDFDSQNSDLGSTSGQGQRDRVFDTQNTQM
ncbi:hypothetical protein C0995_016391 [Termitomyces sp. Mi166|nr:hypothetical protein C0995_016391 [Termitomyces sp. Mi166\